VVTDAKYLGVSIASDLKWDTHVKDITAKANRTLCFIRRNLKVSSPKIKERAYFGLVRPRLEYASTVWDPYTASHKHALEMVQRRAARWVLHRYHNTSSVTEMLGQLGWRTLQQRRVDARLCMWYKMTNGLVALSPHSFAQQNQRISRRTNPLGFIPLQTTKDVFRYSYIPRTIFAWNALPSNIVLAPTLETFRSRVTLLSGHASANF
jgi:hypothetical protein